MRFERAGTASAPRSVVNSKLLACHHVFRLHELLPECEVDEAGEGEPTGGKQGPLTSRRQPEDGAEQRHYQEVSPVEDEKTTARLRLVAEQHFLYVAEPSPHWDADSPTPPDWPPYRQQLGIK